MTDYRIVARHVRYWRGQVHRWSTVYRFTGTIAAGSYGTAIAAIKTLDDGVCYHPASPVTGGIYEVAIYDHATGGVPVDIVTYFDWTTPASWIQYGSAGWGSLSSSFESNAEAALQIEWHAGLSVTGKPVVFRKWYHAVPQIGGGGTGVDVTAGQVTSLSAIVNAQIAVVGGLGAPMGTGSRLAATNCVVKTYFGSHQMPRGRRRKPLVTASGRYTGPTIQIPQSPPVLPD